MIGLWLGVVALATAIGLFLAARIPRWIGSLVAGVAIGVACYYLLALYWIFNSPPGGGAGGS